MTDSASSREENNAPVASGEIRSEEPASYHAILKAAITQFAQKGFEGTRIETVAREAKFNKALVYRHFGDKEGLFKAALRQKLDERMKLLPPSPLAIVDVMFSYLSETLKDREYIRMIMGEAMYDDGNGVIDEDWRHEYYQRHTELVEEVQKNGNLPDSIAPEFLTLIFTSITLFPAILPQVARMYTGYSPDSVEFQQRWKTAIKGFERALRQSSSNKCNGL